MACVPVRSDLALVAGTTMSIDERRIGVIGSAYTTPDGTGIGIAFLSVHMLIVTIGLWETAYSSSIEPVAKRIQ